VKNDLVGVGAGPANLSLAALITSARERGLTSIKSRFFERNQAISWHSGQLFPGTLMQTEFYRDLVTPIDPTSRFSFLNYLKSNGRLDQFLCTSGICPSRREFEDYFNWVGKQMGDIVLATDVTSVEYSPETNLFIVETENRSRAQTRYESKHIVLGCGPQPDSTIPSSQAGRVVHVAALLTFNFPNPSRRVLVIGGGQSAAECINFLLDQHANIAMHITWVTRDTAFRALDKGNFSRETYSASYSHAFAPLPRQLRERIIHDDRSVANGITPEIAQALYQRLYYLKHFASSGMGSPSVHMQSNTEVLEIRDEAKGAVVTARALATDQTSAEVYDCVILCTGFDDKSVLDSPIVGAQLKRRISKNAEPNGYAISWDGPRDRMIFVQSENKKTHGLGDTNFVTAPGRNASILNSIAGEEIYKIDNDDRLVTLG
jgi:lysine N6-hydroxylase